VTEPPAPVARLGRDHLRLRLAPRERHILAALVAELRAELDVPGVPAPDGPLARLFPAAFPDDPEADAAYVDLVRADLVDLRQARLAMVEATIDADGLDDAEAEAWLGALNDVRLVLGTSLGIHDDHPPVPGREDPDEMRMAVFAYLGWLVGAFVDALADALPDVPEPMA
jgi:hypothetical protein